MYLFLEKYHFLFALLVSIINKLLCFSTLQRYTNIFMYASVITIIFEYIYTLTLIHTCLKKTFFYYFLSYIYLYIFFLCILFGVVFIIVIVISVLFILLSKKIGLYDTEQERREFLLQTFSIGK